MPMNKISMLLSVVAVVVVVVAAVLLLFAPGRTAPYTGAGGNFTSGAGQSYALAFSLTDPPQVPPGTNALVISYSSVQAHEAGSGGGAWINGTGNGTLNLMALVNSSQVIAGANVPANASINLVRFYISSAYITINGISYNVTVPSGEITASLTGSARINGSSSALIDLSPTVAAIYTQNSTVFVLVPSVKAVIVPGEGSGSAIGSKAGLTSRDKAELEAASPNITVSASSLSASGNATSFSVTVKNNANSNVIIRHVTLLGNISVYVIPELGVNGNAGANASAASHGSAGASGVDVAAGSDGHDNHTGIGGTASGLGVNATAGVQSHGGSSGPGVEQNASANANGSAENAGNGQARRETERGIGVVLPVSANLTANATLEADVHGLVDTGLNIESIRAITFAVSANGTLTVPSSEHDLEGGGYALGAGSSVTFSFSGSIGFGNGHIKANVVPGDAYAISVRGEEGAKASANVTALSG